MHWPEDNKMTVWICLYWYLGCAPAVSTGAGGQSPCSQLGAGEAVGASAELPRVQEASGEGWTQMWETIEELVCSVQFCLLTLGQRF